MLILRKGISLWLMPKKGSPLYEALKSTMDGIKPLFDDALPFEPHITITSDIEAQSTGQVEYVLDRALAASKAVPAIDVVFSSLTYGSTFTKKVYFKVEPRAPLMSLARISREEFVTSPRMMASQKNYSALSQEDKDRLTQQASQQADDWVKNEYKPHLSLAYSNAYPIDEALQRTIETRLGDVFGPDFNTRGLGWTNGRLALVLCEGPVDEWQTLGYRDL